MLEAPRRAPRPAGAHPRWRSTLASTFYGLRLLSNSDRAAVFLQFFCTCLDQAGARCGWVWLEALCLEACKAFEPPGPVQTRQVQGLDLGLALGLQLLLI